MSNKQSLLKKLSEAETGSPELSAEVFKYLHPEYKDWNLLQLPVFYTITYVLVKPHIIRADKIKEDSDYINIKHLTESIDAALEAASKTGLNIMLQKNEKQPFWEVELSNDEDVWLNYNRGALNPKFISINIFHKIPAIAICIALVEAQERV